MKLSIIVPVYNEQANIPELLQRLKATLDQITFDYEMIFVNDNSRD